MRMKHERPVREEAVRKEMVAQLTPKATMVFKTLEEAGRAKNVISKKEFQLPVYRFRRSHQLPASRQSAELQHHCKKVHNQIVALKHTIKGTPRYFFFYGMAITGFFGFLVSVARNHKPVRFYFYGYYPSYMRGIDESFAWMETQKSILKDRLDWQTGINSLTDFKRVLSNAFKLGNKQLSEKELKQKEKEQIAEIVARERKLLGRTSTYLDEAAELDGAVKELEDKLDKLQMDRAQRIIREEDTKPTKSK